MNVLKLDISFLPGFVALDLFGFVETPLFDFWISPSSSLVFLTVALVVFPVLLLAALFASRRGRFRKWRKYTVASNPTPHTTFRQRHGLRDLKLRTS